jgi:hypothetical protein
VIQRTCGSKYHSSVVMLLNAGTCVALVCNLSNGLIGEDLVVAFYICMLILLCHFMQDSKTDLCFPIYKLTQFQVNECRLTFMGPFYVTNTVC